MIVVNWILKKKKTLTMDNWIPKMAFGLFIGLSGTIRTLDPISHSLEPIWPLSLSPSLSLSLTPHHKISPIRHTWFMTHTLSFYLSLSLASFLSLSVLFGEVWRWMRTSTCQQCRQMQRWPMGLKLIETRDPFLLFHIWDGGKEEWVRVLGVSTKKMAWAFLSITWFSQKLKQCLKRALRISPKFGLLANAYFSFLGCFSF